MISESPENQTIICDKCGESETAPLQISGDVFFTSGWNANFRARRYVHVCYKCQTKKQKQTTDWAVRQFEVNTVGRMGEDMRVCGCGEVAELNQWGECPVCADPGDEDAFNDSGCEYCGEDSCDCESAVECICGAYGFRTDGSTYHIADCICGA